MSGRDERPEGNEPYLRMLYFADLDAVAAAMSEDSIPRKTIVVVRRPYDENSRQWNHKYVTLRAIGRKIQVIVTQDTDLRGYYNYQDAGRQFMLW